MYASKQKANQPGPTRPKAGEKQKLTTQKADPLQSIRDNPVYQHEANRLAHSVNAGLSMHRPTIPATGNPTIQMQVSQNKFSGLWYSSITKKYYKTKQKALQAERYALYLAGLNRGYQWMTESQLKKVKILNEAIMHHIKTKNSLLLKDERQLFPKDIEMGINCYYGRYAGSMSVSNPLVKRIIAKSVPQNRLRIISQATYKQMTDLYNKLRKNTNKEWIKISGLDFTLDFGTKSCYELHHLIPRKYQPNAAIALYNFAFATRGGGKSSPQRYGRVGTHEGVFHSILGGGTGGTKYVIAGVAGSIKRNIIKMLGKDPSKLVGDLQWLNPVNRTNISDKRLPPKALNLWLQKLKKQTSKQKSKIKFTTSTSIFDQCVVKLWDSWFRHPMYYTPVLTPYGNTWETNRGFNFSIIQKPQITRKQPKITCYF